MYKLFILLLSFSALAQSPLKVEIKELLSDIGVKVKNSNDRQLLNKTKKRLENILSSLDGGVNPPPRPRNSTLSCVARDNDGRDPWVLALRDISTLKKTKLVKSNVGSLQNCQLAKDNSIVRGQNAVVCIARDDDGRSPYSIALYRGSNNRKVLNNMGSLQDCTASLGNGIANRTAAAFCVTRDNDGRSPYREMSVNLQTGSVSYAGSYSSLDQCLAAKKVLLD
jgi:hypothetical protein